MARENYTGKKFLEVWSQLRRKHYLEPLNVNGGRPLRKGLGDSISYYIADEP